MSVGDTDPPARRVVLDGVPRVRYMKDGMCPFALCLKSCTDFLGEQYPYGYILGASGACFRMSWNFTQWDEGNMDLAALGPQPFRRGLRAVGLKHRFVLKESWWPGEKGDDITHLPDTAETKALFRREIVKSLCRGRPALAFGVVGPPEVSIVFGYDDGGDVLIGWSCMGGDHPKDQREPSGAFRKRDWFAGTHGLILIEGAPAELDVDAVYREGVEWACRVCTMPRTKTHCFGAEAYKGWAEAMLKDAAFPPADDKTLQRRRHTVWDGLIMLAERGHAAEFLEEAAKRRPDAGRHLRQAARLFRADGNCGRDAAKVLGGPSLPSRPLADPAGRRTAADSILQAGENHAEAVRRLGMALGRQPEGFVFHGKELKGLRPARRWMTLLGCIKGCMRYLGKDVDDAWLYGLTGAAFLLNIDENVDVSGPTSWSDPASPAGAHLRKMAPHVGVSLGGYVRALTSDADYAAKQRAAREFVKAKIDAGVPCCGWDGCREWFTVNGYSKTAYLQWSHYYDGGYKSRPWSKLGRNITECFEITSVEPADPPADERATIRAALDFALSLRPTGKPLNWKNEIGLQAYDLWIRCLETGDWLKGTPPGVHHNVACWHECRCYAERFLRLAGDKMGGELKPLFDEAADHYRDVHTALRGMQTIFIYKYPLPPVDQAGVQRGVKLLRAAKEAEAKGLAVIEKIANRLAVAAEKSAGG